MDQLLVSVNDAAASLGIGRSCMNSMLDREIRSVKVGRRRLVAVADLAAYVDSLLSQDQSAVA